MQNQRLESIRRGLAAVWDSKGRRFVSFEAGDEDRWVQYLDGELNVRWPLDEEPERALAVRGVRLPGAAFVTFWTARHTAQIAVGDLRLDEVAELVEGLLGRVVAEPDAPVEVRVEEHR